MRKLPNIINKWKKSILLTIIGGRFFRVLQYQVCESGIWLNQPATFQLL